MSRPLIKRMVFRRCWLAIAVCVGIAGTSAGARGSMQGPPAAPASPAAQPAAAVAASPFTFLEHTLLARFESDGKSRRELRLRIRMNDDVGARHWTQIPLTYAPESEELQLGAVRVHKPSGETVDVGRQAVQELTIRPHPELPLFLDLRQKLITVPALVSGDVLALTAVWTVSRPLVRDHFWFEYAFVTDAIVEQQLLELDVPASKAVIVRVRDGAPVGPGEETSRIEGNRRLYRWTHKNSVVATADANDGHDDTPAPDVRLTTFRNWAEVSRWYRSVSNLSSNEAVSAKALELTKGITDPARRIEAIYDFVATRIRYISLSFGIGRFVPHPPGEVLRNQYGDCKDKHALLAALLSAIDVTAYPVLINTRRSISDDLSSPSEFDHVITVIPRGPDPATWIWLDTTTEVAPFGMLIATLRDRRALLVADDPAHQSTVLTPADPPFPMMSSVQIEGRVNTIGALSVRVVARLRNETEPLARITLRGASPATVTKFAEGFAQASGLTGDISDAAVSNLTSTREPLELSFRLRRGNYLAWAAPSTSVVPLSSKMSIPGYENGAWSPKKDVKVGTPQAASVRSVIELPEAYSAQAPVGVSVARGGINYRSKYEVVDRRLIVERELTTSARVLKTSDVAEYEALGRAIAADANQKISIRSSGVTFSEIPSDATASELYYAAYSAFDNKKYDPALTLWQRAIELDPKMAFAWNGIAWTHQRNGRYADAIAAIRKQIALEPLGKRAHADLGYIQREAGDLESAAEAYARHVEINPLDAGAFNELGEINFDLERYAAAIVAFEKAIGLGVKDAWSYSELGAAYLASGDRERARGSFDRAIAMSNTPEIWSQVAFELADANVDLDRATDLARRTMQHAAKLSEGLTASSVTNDTLDLVEDLAWAWDAHGMALFRRGETDEALLYVRAAWQLTDSSIAAEHLAGIHEQADRSADAASAYLIAFASADKPSGRLREHLRKHKLSNATEFLNAANIQRFRERSVELPERTLVGKADFLVVAQPGRRVHEAKMLSGDASLRPLEPLLRQARLPLEFPEGSPSHLPLIFRAVCDGKQACMAVITPARNASLPK